MGKAMAEERKAGITVALNNETKQGFDAIKRDAQDTAQAVTKAGQDAAKGISQIGAGGEQAAQKLDGSARSIISSIQRATAAAEAGQKGTAKYFEVIGRQRGVGADVMEPYLAQLRKVEAAQAASMGNMAMSAKATAAAMRGVPAQLSDIFVSLQGGMPVMTVFFQQGLQLRDMFGGFASAGKALGTTIAGMITPLTVTAGAVAALGVAYYQGSKEADEYRRSLALSGNQAGITVDQLNAMARSMSDSVGTQGRAAAGLAEMAQKSKVGSDNLKEYTEAAIQWAKVTGQAVSETAKQFADLANDPLKAALALNEQMNFLTASVYDQIKALDEQGRKEEAAAVAQKAYADAMKTRAAELKQNLGALERGWNSIADAARGAWDAMLNVGRTATTADTLSAVRKELADLEKRSSGDFGETSGGAATGRPSAQAVSRIQARIAALKAQETQLLATAEAEKKNADAQAAQKAAVDSANALDHLAGQFASKEIKRKQELTAAENIYLKSVGDTMKAYANTPELTAKLVEQAEKYEKTVAGINKKYNEKSGSPARSENEIAAIKARIAEEEQLIARFKEYGAEAEKITPAERKIAELRAQIGETTNKTVKAEKQRALALAENWLAIEKERIGIEDAAKAKEKQLAAMYKSADATAAEAEAVNASLAVYGKARTEIERMTLAKLRQQQADMALVGNPEYMAALAKQIEEQEKLVEGLQRLDYKKLDDKLTKSLDLAKEELAIQRDGLSLLGLDEVQRKKVVAQRKIELDLAKQIAEIDRAKFSDNDLENEQQKEALRQKARLKAETDTQTTILKIQEEYVNQQVQQYDEVFRRGFADMLNNGKDGWDAFTQSLTTTFKTTVADQIYKMFLRPFVVQVVASLVGVTGAGSGIPGVGGGASGGILGGLQAGQSLWSAFSGGTSGVLASGVMGLGKLMGSSFLGELGAGISAGGQLGLGGTASLIGSAGGTTGAGMVIGAAAPWLAGAAALYGLISSLDDSGTPHLGAAARYRNGSSEQYRQGMPADAWVDQTYTTVSAITTALGKALDNTAKAFGQKAGYEIISAFSDDSSKDGAFGALHIVGPDGKKLVDWSSFDPSWGGRWFADGQEGATQWANATAMEVKGVLEKMDIPAWSRQLLDAAKDLDSLNAALQQIGAVKAVFDQLGQSMQIFSGISGDLQTQLLQTAGSMDALVSNANAFDQGFYSEAERMARLNDQVTRAIQGMGFEINPFIEGSKETFRQLVEAAMGSGQGELAAKLMALSGAFANAADYAAKAADEAQKAAKAAADEAQKRARDAAIANFEAAVGREQEYWQKIVSDSQAAAQAISNVLNPLKQSAKELFGTVEAAQQMQAAQGMVYIEQALAGMRGGAKLSDYGGLTDAITTARGGLTSGRYASQFERDRDALVLANQLSQIAGYGNEQLSFEERQVKASQEQLERLDKTLAYWRDLLDDNKAQIDATLSVAQAIQPLYALIPEAKKPGTTTPATPSGGAVWGGSSGGGSASSNVKLDLDAGTRTYADGSVQKLTPDEIYWLRLQMGWQNLPSYDVGTNYVQRDQIAKIHQGEAIVPKAFNPWAGGGMNGGNNNARLEALVAQLIEENRTQAGQIVRLQGVVAKLLQRWDGDGLPHTREEAIA